MRVSQLLKQLNIGLPTLNEEMTCLQFPPFQLNSKLSDEDSKFLIDYFGSEEMKAMTSAKLEVLRCRHRLNQFFVGEKKPIEQLGMMEKSLYFKWILNYGENIVSFRNRFPFVSSYGYSEEIFVKLYDWYFSWIAKNEQERVKIETEAKKKRDKALEFSTLRECPDEELMIMNALENGCGDVFGF
jgi:hypothetical protein